MLLPESKDLLRVPQPAASEQGGVVLLQTVTAALVSAEPGYSAGRKGPCLP